MGLLEWVIRERYYKDFEPSKPRGLAVRVDDGDRVTRAVEFDREF